MKNENNIKPDHFTATKNLFIQKVIGLPEDTSTVKTTPIVSNQVLSEKTTYPEHKKHFSVFYKLRYVFYVISVVLLLFVIQKAFSDFMDGKMAEKNAQESLEMFEEIILKSDVDAMAVKFDDTDDPVLMAIQIPPDTVEQIIYTPLAKLNIIKRDSNATTVSEGHYALLDISVNTFFAPDPNEAGEFIEISQNYSNKSCFGSLDLLAVGDLIELADSTGRIDTFEVFEIWVIKSKAIGAK